MTYPVRATVARPDPRAGVAFLVGPHGLGPASLGIRYEATQFVVVVVGRYRQARIRGVHQFSREGTHLTLDPPGRRPPGPIERYYNITKSYKK